MGLGSWSGGLVIPRAERFWRKVHKTDGCWLWIGATVGGGYGFFWDGERNGVAHRYSWTLHFGPIPPGMRVCHTCDNPPCVRPDHLFLGTSSDNERDKYRKGRARNVLVERMRAKTRCAQGHPFSRENTHVWRGRRRCRTCRRTDQQRRRARTGS